MSVGLAPILEKEPCPQTFLVRDPVLHLSNKTSESKANRVLKKINEKEDSDHARTPKKKFFKVLGGFKCHQTRP